jgi:hypothetical protein
VCLWLTALTLFLPLAAPLTASGAMLVWEASPGAGVADYVVYYGTRSHSYSLSFRTGGEPSFVLPALKPGRNYHFAVTAMSWDGQESVLSDEVSFTIPSLCDQPVPLTALPVPGVGTSLTLQPIAGTKYQVSASDDGQTWNVIWTTPIAIDETPLGFLDLAGLDPSSRTYRAEVLGHFSEMVEALTVTPISLPGVGTRIRFSGAYGRIYVLEASDAGSDWTEVYDSRPVMEDGPVEYVDARPDLPGTRLYRLFVAADPDGPYWDPCGGAANDAPSLSDIVRQRTYLGLPTSPIGFTVFDPDTPLNHLRFSATSSEGSLVPNGNIVFGGNGSGRSVTITPAPGAAGLSVITLSVSDGDNVATTTFEVEVLPYTPDESPLSVRLHGSGSVRPSLDGQVLQIGQRYKMTAVADPGHIFTGWSGGAAAASSSLAFVMEPDLVLEANFIPDPFPQLEGAYQGLVAQPDATLAQYVGCLRLNATARGSYSGSITLGGKKSSFSGKLAPDRQSTNTIARSGRGPLWLELAFADDPAAPLGGRVTDGNWQLAWSAKRSPFNPKTNPAPVQGTYTVIFPGQEDPGSGPQGAGYGLIKVNAAGTVSLSGVLADGSKISQSIPLSQEGWWPLYVSLSSGQAFLAGSIILTNGSDNHISGVARWVRPGSAHGQYSPEGFTNSLPLMGSQFLGLPSLPSPAFTLDYYRLGFSGGNLSPGFTNQIALDAKNKLINLSSNKLSFTISASSGLFSGKVTNPNTGKSASYQGAFLQMQNLGAGFLLGTNRSSLVSLGF